MAARRLQRRMATLFMQNTIAERGITGRESGYRSQEHHHSEREERAWNGMESDTRLPWFSIPLQQAPGSGHGSPVDERQGSIPCYVFSLCVVRDESLWAAKKLFRLRYSVQPASISNSCTTNPISFVHDVNVCTDTTTSTNLPSPGHINVPETPSRLILRTVPCTPTAIAQLDIMVRVHCWDVCALSLTANIGQGRYRLRRSISSTGFAVRNIVPGRTHALMSVIGRSTNRNTRTSA